MNDLWQKVLADHYGRPETELMARLTCYSRHYFVTAQDGGHVLSRTVPEPRRLPYELQFGIVRGLLRRGVRTVQPPVLTTAGEPYVVTADGHRWCLRAYTPNDHIASWFLPDRIESAARHLAGLHRAGAGSWWTEQGLPDIDPATVDPFHWETGEVLDRLPWLLARAARSGITADALARVTAAARALSDERDQLDLAHRLGLYGLAHEDYRPDNLLVRNGKVVRILDWDLARRDHQLYDLAFAALQFGGRQCLRPSTSLVLADQFIDAYLKARELPGLRTEHPRLIDWMLRFAVVKRLFTNGITEERLRLLHRLERHLAG
ncbi:MAG: phosphotransferase [Streptosporangiales bacterium]|nr:phosphotransferase [Streptosporangiales bacterium]